jgi:lipopolysaccharide export system protein LptA
MQIKRSKILWRRWREGLCIAFCSLAVVYSLAGAGESKPATKEKSGKPFQADKNEPIYINSDRMEVDRKKGTITYSGRVVALQGEAKIKSDKLTASYSADMKEMREIVAEGSVHITHGKRVATGNRAIFDGKKQTITLTGNPVAVVRQGNSEISGSRITFFIEEDRAVAEGRVKGILFPGELTPSKKKESGSDTNK